jgi:hypothetical protein
VDQIVPNPREKPAAKKGGDWIKDFELGAKAGFEATTGITIPLNP